MKSLRAAFSILLLVTLGGLAALASDDPPGRVARLDYTSGSVSIQPRGVDDWVAAAMNRPMTTSDRVWTDKESRAELQLGSGAIRLNSETSLTLSNVSDNAIQLELDQGTLNLRVVALYPGEIYEIDTPNMAFTILKPGSYRFDVDPDGDASSVTVWKGEGEATGDGPAQRVHSGDRARFTKGRSLEHFFGGAPGMDGFDEWAQVRDQRTDHVVSSRYVNRGVVGYEDLDDYGYWRNVPTYGWVWSPYRVAGGWAPYRYGHWIWLEPWGWTWVDDAPWGFAPFHYGRWVYYNAGWCWAPGPYYSRPIWAPALVGWFGGPRWGVSFGFGGVGWFPLGWGEPYYPFYRHSYGYFHNVNVYNTHITNITYISNNYYGHHERIGDVHYAYRDRVNAVTGVDNNVFTHGRPVQGSAFAFQEKQLHGAPILASNGLTPTRESVLGANAGHTVMAPPSRTQNQRVVSRMTAPERPAPTFRGSPETPGTRGEVAPRSVQADNNPRTGGNPVADNPRGMDNPRGGQPQGRGQSPDGQAAANGRVVHRPPTAGNVADTGRPETSRPDVRSRETNPTMPSDRGSRVPRPTGTPGPETRGPERQSPSTEARGPQRPSSPDMRGQGRQGPPQRESGPPQREAGPRQEAPRTQGGRAPRPPERQTQQHERQQSQPRSYMNSGPSQNFMASERGQAYSAPQWQSMRAAPQWHASGPAYRSESAMGSRQSYSGGRASGPSYSGGGRASAPSYSGGGRGGSASYSRGGGGGGGRGGRSR